MNFFSRLTRRPAEAQALRRNGQVVLAFRYNGGLLPLASLLPRWPELAPLAGFVPRPDALENPVPEAELPALFAAMDTLAEQHARERKLTVTVADDARTPPRAKPPRTAPPPVPAPAPAPERAGVEDFFRDAAALLSRTEASADPVPFDQPYPRYDQLNPFQRRWYLYLRARLRAGQAPDTHYSYLLLYIYELVNGLGVPDARAGLDALVALWQGYHDRCPKLSGAPSRWIWDFVRVNELPVDPVQLLSELPGLPDTVADAMLTAVQDSGAPARLPLWLLERLSGLRLADSKFVQGFEDPGQLAAEFSDAVAAVDAALRAGGGKGILGGRCLARLRVQEVSAFRGAPVKAEREYVLRRRNYCENPRFRTYMALLLRYIENGLRARHKYAGRLKAEAPDEVTRAAVDAFLGTLAPAPPAQTPAPAAPKLRLDMDSILRLRAESDAVREALLASVAAEADWSEPELPAPEEPAEPEDRPPKPEAEGARPALPADIPGEWRDFLALADLEVLRAVLDGPDALAGLARRRGDMAGLLLDQLNEAAADTLGDLVADETGVYEEYAEPLARILERL